MYTVLFVRIEEHSSVNKRKGFFQFSYNPPRFITVSNFSSLTTMDSDSDASDDMGFVFDSTPARQTRTTILDESDDEATSGNLFHAHFLSHYDASPVFFDGSFEAACNAAFHTGENNGHRPMLVYIHHDQSVFNHIFCQKTLCSEVMVEFLLENYIIWPWDVTLEANRNRLSTIWKQIFSIPLFNRFTVDTCPMLFGITRRPLEGRRWLPTVDYQFWSLLKGDTLIRTQETATLETLLSELITFKEESNVIEQALVTRLFLAENIALDDNRLTTGTINSDNGYGMNVDGSESFYTCLEQRYRYCPTFVTGTLRSACEAIVNSPADKDYRPLLVYFHDDNSEFNGTICPITLIDSLLENFFVYVSDNTLQEDKDRMATVWRDIFSYFPYSDPDAPYPRLFGIMKLSVEENNGMSASNYQFVSLLQGKTLTSKWMVLSGEALWEDLISFKQNCMANEEALACDFITNTGLSWNIILQISEYLSLNDIVNSFSTRILSMLVQSKTKVHLCNPSEELLRMASRKLNVAQVISMELDSAHLRLTSTFMRRYAFTNIQALTFVNVQRSEEFTTYLTLLSGLSHVRFKNDETIDPIVFKEILGELPSTVRRLEIRYEESPPTCHTQPFLIDNEQSVRIDSSVRPVNRSIQYFLFDISRLSSTSILRLDRRYNLYLLREAVHLIRQMPNIRCVSFSTDENSLNTLLDIEHWRTTRTKCFWLKKVILKVPRNMLSDPSVTQQIAALQKKPVGRPRNDLLSSDIYVIFRWKDY